MICPLALHFIAAAGGADAEATGDPAILAYARTEQGRTLYQWGSNAAAAVPLRRAVAMRPEDAGPGTAAVARGARRCRRDIRYAKAQCSSFARFPQSTRTNT